MFEYNKFSEWIDRVLNIKFPDNTIAFNFNLYEECEEDTYAVQIAGTEKFEEEDWACYETFSTGEDLYCWTEEGGWEKAYDTAKANVLTYLKNGMFSDAMKKYKGIGLGFVDGDIEIIYRK